MNIAHATYLAEKDCRNLKTQKLIITFSEDKNEIIYINKIKEGFSVCLRVCLERGDGKSIVQKFGTFILKGRPVFTSIFSKIYFYFYAKF